MKNATLSKIRSTAAVFAGLVTIAVLSHATDELLRAGGALPAWGVRMSDAAFAAALAYRTLFGVLGCYVTARIAPSRPETHAMVLGSLGLVASLAAAIATWNRGPEFGPHWYPLALVATALPNAWLGARLAREASARRAPSEQQLRDVIQG
jgi:hypothetical protein